MIERILPDDAPRPRGPYSPAIRAGDFIFVSGQGPVDPATDTMVAADIRTQTRLALENIDRILAACGATPTDVVRCGVFLADAADFAAMNEVYAEFFGEHKPARTTVVTNFVAPGMKIEVDCVAFKPRQAS